MSGDGIMGLIYTSIWQNQDLVNDFSCASAILQIINTFKRNKYWEKLIWDVMKTTYCNDYHLSSSSISSSDNWWNQLGQRPESSKRPNGSTALSCRWDTISTHSVAQGPKTHCPGQSSSDPEQWTTVEDTGHHRIRHSYIYLSGH